MPHLRIHPCRLLISSSLLVGSLDLSVSFVGFGWEDFELEVLDLRLGFGGSSRREERDESESSAFDG
jgi:hypothetical protein